MQARITCFMPACAASFTNRHSQEKRVANNRVLHFQSNLLSYTM
jgi:hypothetical protein